MADDPRYIAPGGRMDAWTVGRSPIRLLRHAELMDERLREAADEIAALKAKLYQAKGAVRHAVTCSLFRLRSPTKECDCGALPDWDAAIQVAPVRPSGELPVTLEYAGRATPMPNLHNAATDEIAALRQAAAVAYQFCGARGANTRLLDNLSALANGEPAPHKEWPVETGEWQWAAHGCGDPNHACAYCTNGIVWPEPLAQMICALCGSPAFFNEKEKVWRHVTRPGDAVICDKYGYPIDVVSSTNKEVEWPIADSLRGELRQEEFSEGYAESFLDAYIATQIKVLREQNELTQSQLAERLGTTQTAISRIESVNYSGWNISTLKRLARAFNVRLKVSFETYGSLIRDVKEFNRDSLRRTPRSKDPELSVAGESE